MNKILLSFAFLVIGSLHIDGQISPGMNNNTIDVRVQKDYTYDIAYGEEKLKRMNIEIGQQIQFIYEDMVKYMKQSYDGGVN